MNYRPTLLDSYLVVFSLLFLGWLAEFSGFYDPLHHTYHLSFFSGIFLALSVGVVLLVLIKWRREAYLLFTDVRFCIASASVLAIATILGTLILQGKAPEQYTAVYGEKLARLLQNLYLTRVFWSVWYALLFAAFFLGLLLVPLRRKAFRLEKLGFLITHWGFALIILGGFLGYFFGYSGQVRLFPGEEKGSILLERSQKIHSLPFQIYLKKFWIDYYPPERKLDLFLSRQTPQSPMQVHLIRTWDLKEILGKKIPLLRSPYQFVVEEYYPHFGWKKRLSKGKKGKDSVLALTLTWDYQGKEETVVLFPQIPQRSFHTFPKRRLLLWVFEKPFPKGAEKNFLSGQIPAKHRLLVQKQDQIQWLEVEVGKSYEVDGITLKVEEFYPKAVWDPERKKIRNQKRGSLNPVLLVTFYQGEEKQSLYLFHGHPPLKVGESLQLAYDYAKPHEGYDFYLLGSVEEKKFYFVKDGKILRTFPLSALSLREIDFQLKDLKTTWVSFEFDPVNLSKEHKNPAIKLSIWKGEEKVLERWLFAKPQDWSEEKVQSAVRVPTGEYILRFRFNRPVRHYVSEVEIREQGEKKKEGSIRVNEPLWYKSHGLYQTSHIGEEGTILTVSYDPGLVFVFVGIGMCVLGLPYMFYVAPYLVARRKRKIEI